MADGQEPLASCRQGKCPQYYYVTFQCYIAVAMNLAAAVAAFILIDWEAKQADKSRVVSKLMLFVGQYVCMRAISFELQKDR